MVLVIINIEEDYMDIYGGSLEKMKDIYVDFIYNLLFYGLVVVCIDFEVVVEFILCFGCFVIIYGELVEVDYCMFDFS